MTSIQQGIRMIFAVGIALFCYGFFRWPQAYWLILVSFLFVQIYPNNFFWRDLAWIAFYGSAFATVVLILHFFSNDFMISAIFLAGLTFVSVYLGLLKPSMFLPNFSIILLSMTNHTIG